MLEGKKEGGTEAALLLFFCDEIESVVTGRTNTHRIRRVRSSRSSCTPLMIRKRKLKRRGSFKL